MSKPNTASRPDQTTASNGEGGAERDGNVDKIRDILFGSQMRELDRKFVQLEGKLMKEVADIREDVKRRFASIEAFVKGEIEAVDSAQNVEKQERAESVKELTTESRETAKRLEKRLAQVEEESTKALRALRQLLLDESKRLSEEIGDKHAQGSAHVAREMQEVRGMLTDRHALSDLFAELSLRLKNEFKLPGE